MRPTHVLETSLYASDLEAARHFYGTVLNLPVVFDEPGRHLSFRCGRGIVHVFIAAVTRDTESLPAHGVDGAVHAAFAVPYEQIEAWRTRFSDHDIPIEDTAAWPHHERAVSLYVRDPAGNSIEICTPELWAGGGDVHDDAVRQIRPPLRAETGRDEPIEQFQNRTLRPICTLQRPLLMMAVTHCLQEDRTGREPMAAALMAAEPMSAEHMDGKQTENADRKADLRTLIRENRHLKQSLIGLVTGHFTKAEYAFYLDHQREVQRRLVEIVTQQVLDQQVLDQIDTRTGDDTD
jgi:catechol 2,3-dioxygenase-like lactoylglutathione lyase family enzyme